MNSIKKKGFTLVELVIVIAVIAILAGVLIGTFSLVLTNANKSKAMQEAKSKFTEYLIEIDYVNNADAAKNSYVIAYGNYYFAVKDGQFNTTIFDTETEAINAAIPANATVAVETELKAAKADIEDGKCGFVLLSDYTGFYEYTVK